MGQIGMFRAIRAIGVEFIERIYRPLFIIIAVIAVSLLALVGWATTISGWWWILEVFLIIVSTVALIIGLFVVALTRAAKPQQTKTQKQAVGAFVDTLQSLSETIQTPVFILLFHIVRDVVAPKKSGSYIGTLASKSSSLKGDFQAIVNSFA